MLVLSAELDVPVLDAAAHMALDEAVLLCAPASDAVLRVYRWVGRGCTFGYSQPYSAAQAACAEHGLKEVTPVRRATGGGIVFHDGDITFSLIFPWDRTCAPETIYKNIHRGVHAALKTAGLTTALWSPPRRPLSAAARCFTRAEPMDLVTPEGSKILGGALRKKGARGLYQGSLRGDVLGADHSVCETAIEQGLAREFNLPLRRELEKSWRELALTLETRYRSCDWNQRR